MNTKDQGTAHCFVCRKHRGEIAIPGGAIYEDDWVYAGHRQIPEGQAATYLGYLFAEPKRHVPGWAELSDGEAQALGISVGADESISVFHSLGFKPAPYSTR